MRISGLRPGAPGRESGLGAASLAGSGGLAGLEYVFRIVFFRVSSFRPD